MCVDRVQILKLAKDITQNVFLAPAIKSLFPCDLSSDSPSTDTDEEDISAPIYTVLYHQIVVFSMYSFQNHDLKFFLKSSLEEEVRTTSWVELNVIDLHGQNSGQIPIWLSYCIASNNAVILCVQR